MSKRGHLEYLADMREAIVRVQSYTSGVTYGQFLADPKTQDAVVRNIEIIGAHPEVEWANRRHFEGHEMKKPPAEGGQDPASPRSARAMNAPWPTD